MIRVVDNELGIVKKTENERYTRPEYLGEWRRQTKIVWATLKKWLKTNKETYIKIKSRSGQVKENQRTIK